MQKYLKSKTIMSAVAVAIIVMLQLGGVGEEPTTETIDQMEAESGVPIRQILEILSLLGLGGVAYGRAVAKGPLKRREEDKQ